MWSIKMQEYLQDPVMRIPRPISGGDSLPHIKNPEPTLGLSGLELRPYMSRFSISPIFTPSQNHRYATDWDHCRTWHIAIGIVMWFEVYISK